MSRKYQYAQHFLASPRTVAELIGHSNIRKNDTVVDLGAGSGVIASVLARRAKNVIAVEMEPEALKKLRQNMAELHNVDVVKADIAEVALPTEGYKVFSNIPFNLSADTVRRLTTEKVAPKSIYLIVQKQFAQKVVMSDRHFTSQLGAEISPWWQTRVRKPLRKTDFTPPPAVDTVLLEIKPRLEALLPEADKDSYRRFITACYTRQNIFAELPREQAGISAERKPSELTSEQWVKLYRLTSTGK